MKVVKRVDDLAYRTVLACFIVGCVVTCVASILNLMHAYWPRWISYLGLGLAGVATLGALELVTIRILVRKGGSHEPVLRAHPWPNGVLLIAVAALVFVAVLPLSLIELLSAVAALFAATTIGLVGRQRRAMRRARSRSRQELSE
jgi:uncharacterized protein involved in cysteine biosynthesis